MAIRRNDILICAMTWMNLENITGSEMSQIKRQILHDSTYVKCTEQPNSYRGYRGLREGGDWRWAVITIVSVWGDDKILETENGDDYTTA